ncbi:hypothetical protein AGMMS49525_08450 [Bacteroidia bacterium]|nr:hypothetical protein AGMMS49525_08450 [Bacteroidia bacterium]
MKRIKFILIALCVTALSWGGCNSNNDETPIDETVTCECEEKQIIKVLKDEPAHVVKSYFEFGNGTDSIGLAILNKSVWASYYIFPCSEIPQNYQIDGLEVLISGNITNCIKPFPSNPTARYAPAHLFELTSIKKK